MASDSSSELSMRESLEAWEEAEVLVGLDLPSCRNTIDQASSTRPGSSEEGYEEGAEEGDDEESYDSLISAMKQASDDGYKQTTKRDSPESVKLSLPVTRPGAPTDPVIPATLSSRKKSPHHAGGWHGRTIKESEAARKLESLIDEDVGDLSPIVTDIVTKARQKVLRLITEGDEKTIEVTLKAIVEKFRRTPQGHKIRYRRVKIQDKIKAKEEPVIKMEEDVKGMLDAKARERLQKVLSQIEEVLAREQSVSPAGHGKQEAADFSMADGMDVAMF